MPSFSRADWRIALMAVTGFAVLSLTPLQAQQDQKKSGTEATSAMGTQVPQMKPDCAPKTMAGNKQKEQAPTAAMNEAVPPMKAGDCPADDASTGTKTPPK